MHILEGDEAGARLADMFTRGKGGIPVFEGAEVKVEEMVVGILNDGQRVLPRVLDSGVRRVLRCEVLKGDSKRKDGLVPVGDHVVVLGEVVEVIEVGEGTGMEMKGMGTGLGYVDGKYRGVGEEIEVGGDKERV